MPEWVWWFEYRLLGPIDHVLQFNYEEAHYKQLDARFEATSFDRTVSNEAGPIHSVRLLS